MQCDFSIKPVCSEGCALAGRVPKTPASYSEVANGIYFQATMGVGKEG